MMMILQIIVMISIIIMSVLGNLLVLISVLCNRALRQPPNLLLLSLAVTDMLVSLLGKYKCKRERGENQRQGNTWQILSTGVIHL